MSIPLPENRAMKYGYSNARVKCMKGLFLKPGFLDELIKVKSIPAMAELLERTNYKEDLTALSLKYHGSELIELAARKHFSRVVKKVISFTPRGDKKIVEGLLKRWDLLNLKIILNGVQKGKRFEDMKDKIFPLGLMSVKHFEKISNSTVDTFFDAIKSSSFGKEILSVSSQYFNKRMFEAFKDTLKKGDQFTQIQVLLDVYGYMIAEKYLALSTMDISKIRGLLRNEIDAKNILIIERLKTRKKYDANAIREHLIVGGSLRSQLVNEIINSKNLSTTAVLLSKKFRGFVLPSKDNMSLVDLEVALEKAIAYEKLKVFSNSVLSVGVILGFLLLKEEEIKNLGKIAMAKEFGFSENETKDMLVVV
ncbi:MAG: V-type ATPase subunit [Candidatus Micrarchaeota archaeon]